LVQDLEKILLIISRNKSLIKKLRKEGYNAYYSYGVKGFLYTLKAGVIIISHNLFDVNPYVIGKDTIIVQFWHGSPLKKLGFDDKINYEYNKKSLTGILPYIMKIRSIISNLRFPDPIIPYMANYNVLIIPSEEAKVKYGRAFGIKKENIFITGYPRNDVFFNNDWIPAKYKLTNMKDTLGIKHDFEYFILYLPTYRDRGGIQKIFEEYDFDLSKIDEFLKRINAIMVIKLHYMDRKLIRESFPYHSKRIFILSDKEMPDVYPILKECNILITDYSSVYFDYLLLNKPIIFAPFDIEEYMKNDREFYYDYEAVTPGPKAKNWIELMAHIEEIIKNDKWERERAKISATFNKFKDGKSSERAAKVIKELLKK